MYNTRGKGKSFRHPTRKWMAAYAALHGVEIKGQQQVLNIDPLGEYSTPPKKRRKVPENRYNRDVEVILNCKTEQEEQFRVAAWLRKNQILFYHVPNGGKRDYWEAVKLKRLGVSAGVPDLVIPIARKGHHGLYIELKRVSGGKVSQLQQWWMDKLLAEGYDCYVAHGADDLILYVQKYLSET